MGFFINRLTRQTFSQTLIAYIAEIAVYLASLPWAILADLITYPLRLGLYYALELPLFHMLQSFRAVLVMTGYMLPMEDEIAQILIQIGNMETGAFKEVLNLDGDVFAGWLPPPEPTGAAHTYRDPNYPHSIPTTAGQHPDEFRRPWSYPTSVRELHWTDTAPLPTTSGPHDAGTGPGVLFGAVRADPTIRDRFETAADPGEADRVGQDVTPARHLGDAVGFTEYLLWLSTRDPVQKDGTQVPLTEWNLDSDCGYGYHCWDWNRKSSPNQDQDPEGFKYFEPCTHPPQTGQSFLGPISWNAVVPLQLHWDGPDLEDPGCQGTPPILLARAPRADDKATESRPLAKLCADPRGKRHEEKARRLCLCMFLSWKADDSCHSDVRLRQARL
jgi:hypothetical protein